jgi:hypothetical protein
MRLPESITLVTALVCTLGCGGRDRRLEEGATVKGVQALGGDLAYVQSNAVMQRVNVMAGDPQPRTTKTAIRSTPRTLAKRPSPDPSAPIDELLIVSDGRTDAYGEVIENPALTAVSTTNDLRVYELHQPGQLMRPSADGKWAVLFDDPAGPSSDTLLTNPNEIAIVDLTQPPSNHENPVIRTIDAVGGSPQAAWFATLKFDSGTTTIPFVLFSFPRGISLTRLDVPADPGFKIPLESWVPDTGSGKAPVADVQVDPDAAKIYLRNAVSGDVQVLSVTLAPEGSDSGDPNRVLVSQNTLTVGTYAPSDFRVYSEPDPTSPDVPTTRLVVTIGKSVSVVDADSNTVTSVSLTYAADKVFPFDGMSPKDAATRHRAVLYKVGETGLTFVDLEDLEQKTTKAIQSVDLVSAIGSVVQVPSMKDSLLIFMAGGGIEVLDLQTRRWSPIGSAVGITATVADPSQNRSWVTNPGDNRVGYLDFGNSAQPTLSNGEIRLDNPVSQFFRLDSGSMKRVIVTHDRNEGLLTLFDAVKPARPTAKKLEGFLLSDLL